MRNPAGKQRQIPGAKTSGAVARASGRAVSWGRALSRGLVVSALGLGSAWCQAQSSAVISRNFTGSTYMGAAVDGVVRQDYSASYLPPDSTLAVGPGHVVELINSRYAVYQKATGSRLLEKTQDAFWMEAFGEGVSLENPYEGTASFDPRILYDAASGRWFATASDNFQLLVAVSKTSDPTAGWNGFQVDVALRAAVCSLPLTHTAVFDAGDTAGARTLLAACRRPSNLSWTLPPSRAVRQTVHRAARR